MNLLHRLQSKAPAFTSGLVASLFALAGLAIPSAAAAWTMDLPAGQACADFMLRATGTDNPHRVYREFYDKKGNLARLLYAGKGNGLTLTNVSTGASLTLRANGSVENVAVAQDGTTTHSATGHNVLIFFPTDIPAGPSTTLHVGRVIYTVDTSGTWTLVGSSGRAIDVCAALSS